MSTIPREVSFTAGEEAVAVLIAVPPLRTTGLRPLASSNDPLSRHSRLHVDRAVLSAFRPVDMHLGLGSSDSPHHLAADLLHRGDVVAVAVGANTMAESLANEHRAVKLTSIDLALEDLELMLREVRGEVVGVVDRAVHWCVAFRVVVSGLVLDDRLLDVVPTLDDSHLNVRTELLPLLFQPLAHHGLRDVEGRMVQDIPIAIILKRRPLRRRTEAVLNAVHGLEGVVSDDRHGVSFRERG